MSNFPTPTVQQAVAELAHRDEFKVLLQFLRDERDRFFGDLRQAETPGDVMKIAGSVATLDELLATLTG